MFEQIYESVFAHRGVCSPGDLSWQAGYYDLANIEQFPKISVVVLQIMFLWALTCYCCSV